ncbi:pre-mRNA-splicing factor syf2 [Cichlidogyrus casuarinus]|uniref:Pre-mRNA-splicing factor SYF2 n=1 Tax=Cichlidogyrus casuarinus TaxID=1844966 RepID=A0ABD2QMG0_9PLAT
MPVDPEMKERLAVLMKKRNEAKKANMKEVVEEDKRKKLPSNWEEKKARLEYEENEERFKQECKEKGLDPERAKNLEANVDLIERLESKNSRKRANAAASSGFSSYESASHKKYLKQVKNLHVDLRAYKEQKEQLGELAFPSADTIGLIEKHKDSYEAIDRLAKQVTEEAEKKKSFSRRREFDADADIDYINERNKRYNELLDRHYGKYTAEIKQNLERGTAL